MSDPTTQPPPHLTLYINNINESVSKAKLVYVLHRLFSRCGAVADVRVRKSLMMKGQAFVTYKDRSSCEKSLAMLQRRSVFRKSMHISYAKSASDTYLQLSGDTEELEKRQQDRRNKNAEAAASVSKVSKTSPMTKPQQLSQSELKQWRLLPPNNVLLLQNLPPEKLDAAILEENFEKYAGFTKVRLIKFRKVAFIDFELEQQAALCLAEINSCTFGAESLLTYAKR
ncbi:hypothetical protein METBISCDRAFT_26500 [Metschnikowia bicuspidata]|uniref:RRM domain-containing protein n=1 Tax=Metschnikowia bicuspidata TaxID=27322 RepID=A0A4P9ZEX6_9ASCO|nr:hypothetical protein METBISCDRAFT_26500 [Metschnikowia bicuspidata]